MDFEAFAVGLVIAKRDFSDLLGPAIRDDFSDQLVHANHTLSTADSFAFPLFASDVVWMPLAIEIFFSHFRFFAHG